MRIICDDHDIEMLYDSVLCRHVCLVKGCNSTLSDENLERLTHKRKLPDDQEIRVT